MSTVSACSHRGAGSGPTGAISAEGQEHHPSSLNFDGVLDTPRSEQPADAAHDAAAKGGEEEEGSDGDEEYQPSRKRGRKEARTADAVGKKVQKLLKGWTPVTSVKVAAGRYTKRVGSQPGSVPVTMRQAVRVMMDRMGNSSGSAGMMDSETANVTFKKMVKDITRGLVRVLNDFNRSLSRTANAVMWIEFANLHRHESRSFGVIELVVMTSEHGGVMLLLDGSHRCTDNIMVLIGIVPLETGGRRNAGKRWVFLAKRGSDPESVEEVLELRNVHFTHFVKESTDKPGVWVPLPAEEMDEVVREALEANPGMVAFQTFVATIVTAYLPDVRAVGKIAGELALPGRGGLFDPLSKESELDQKGDLRQNLLGSSVVTVKYLEGTPEKVAMLQHRRFLNQNGFELTDHLHVTLPLVPELKAVYNAFVQLTASAVAFAATVNGTFARSVGDMNEEELRSMRIVDRASYGMLSFVAFVQLAARIFFEHSESAAGVALAETLTAVRSVTDLAATSLLHSFPGQEIFVKLAEVPGQEKAAFVSCLVAVVKEAKEDLEAAGERAQGSADVPAGHFGWFDPMIVNLGLVARRVCLQRQKAEAVKTRRAALDEAQAVEELGVECFHAGLKPGAMLRRGEEAAATTAFGALDDRERRSAARDFADEVKGLRATAEEAFLAHPGLVEPELTGADELDEKIEEMRALESQFKARFAALPVTYSLMRTKLRKKMGPFAEDSISNEEPFADEVHAAFVGSFALGKSDLMAACDALTGAVE